MKRIALLAVLALLLSVIPGIADDVLLGRASLVIGEAEYKNPAGADDEFMPLAIGTEIHTGYLLKVPDDGKVEICYLDGAIIRFKGGSRVQFQLNALRLFTGKVWLRIVKSGNKFEVITPTFVAGVRGTVFAVEAKRKEAGSVSVYEGTVYSRTKQKSVDVTAGHIVKIAPTGDMGSPEVLAQQRDAYFAEDNWQAYDRNSAYRRYMMLLLKGIDSQELSNGSAEGELKTRKKLPEVQNAIWTYESYQR